MDINDNRLKLLEDKFNAFEKKINALETINKYLEDLSRCSFCKNVESLFYCTSCFAKVCGNCNITRERTASSGGVEFTIFCRTCL